MAKIISIYLFKAWRLKETIKGQWMEKRRGQRAALWGTSALRVLEEEAVSRGHLRRGPGEMGLKVGSPRPGWGWGAPREGGRGPDSRLGPGGLLHGGGGWGSEASPRVPCAGRCAERVTGPLCLFVSWAVLGLGCGLWNLSSPTRVPVPWEPGALTAGPPGGPST